MEKYRPQLIRDIVGNKEAVARLQVVAEEGNMPNLILSVRTISSQPASHNFRWKAGLKLEDRYRRRGLHAGTAWHRENNLHQVPGASPAGACIPRRCLGAERVRRPVSCSHMAHVAHLSPAA